MAAGDGLGVDVGTDDTLATNVTTIGGDDQHVQRISSGAAPNVTHDQVDVNTSADLIIAANVDRKNLRLKALDGTVYLGDGSGVTTSTGYPLGVGEELPGSAYIGDVYGITAGGTVTVAVWEES